MESLIAAYALAGIAIGAYLGWLGIEASRVAHRLDALETEAHDAATELRQRAA